MTGATIVSSGERIACNDTQRVFAHGAWNLGSILEWRELSTTAAHPGEGLDHVQTVGGEDSYIISPDATAYQYGVLEIDFGQILDCSVDYGIGNEVPCIPFHMNPGAYLRNLMTVDPITSDISPDEPLHTKSGTAGAWIAYHSETTFVDSDGADGEAFADTTVAGDIDSAVKSRINLKQAYFLTDPGVGTTHSVVAYIVLT